MFLSIVEKNDRYHKKVEKQYRYLENSLFYSVFRIRRDPGFFINPDPDVKPNFDTKTATQARLRRPYTPLLLYPMKSCVRPWFWLPTWQGLLCHFFFLQLFLFPGLGGSALRPRFLFYVQYWQDSGIRTRVTPTAARWAINELHTSLMSYTHPCKLHTSLMSYTHAILLSH